MARRKVTLSRELLALCVCLFCHVVMSQNGPQVLPPDDTSNVTVTYANNVDNDNTTASKAAVTMAPTPAPVPERTTAAPTPTPRKRPDCQLLSVYRVRDKLESYLIAGAKLIEIDLELARYPPDFLSFHLPDVYHPEHWVRSTGRQGRSLLVLEDNYDFMSLFFLSIGVYKINVTVTDSPRQCLWRLSAQEILEVIQEALLNDFKPIVAGQDSGSLSVDEHVCHLHIKDNDGYAEFRYTCCHKSPDGDVLCSEVTKDEWIEVLMAFIIITKVLVVLYSPSFLPGSIYRLKYVAMEYIYRIPETSPVKRIKLVVTQFPGSYGNDDKTLTGRLCPVTSLKKQTTLFVWKEAEEGGRVSRRERLVMLLVHVTDTRSH